MPVEVCEGSAKDIAAIMPVMAAAFDPTYGEAWTASQCLSMLALPGSHLFLAVDQARTVGFAMVRGVADEEELLLIAVDPVARRQGIARLLVDAALDNARTKNRDRLFIEVRVNNPAIDFYHKLGFRPVGQRPNYYSGPGQQRFDATTMQLNI